MVSQKKYDIAIERIVGLKAEVRKLQEANAATIDVKIYAQLKSDYELARHNYRSLLECYSNAYRRMLKAEGLVAFLRRFLDANK